MKLMFTSLVLSLAASALAAEPHITLPIPDGTFTGTVGRTFRESSPASLPKPVAAPKGAPNIIVIMLDDAGFGQYATFGGAVPSPAMDRLAAEGLRFNRFHTAGICSPTRAALLTGRNPHNAGVGIVTELATGYDGYTGIIPQSTVPVARILRDNGYATAMFGKNHNTPPAEAGLRGPSITGRAALASIISMGSTPGAPVSISRCCSRITGPCRLCATRTITSPMILRIAPSAGSGA